MRNVCVRGAVVLAVVACGFAAPSAQQVQPAARRGADPIGPIAERTAAMKKIDGFFPMYWDADGGRLWLEAPKLDVEVLHSTGFGTGLGSNDIGIDRGALTGSRIVKFERVGPRLLMVQPNYRFRGTSSNAAEVRDVTEAFARSVLWAFPIAAATDCAHRHAGAVRARAAGNGPSRSTPSTVRGYAPHRELFPRHTGSAFDAITPAVVAADLVVSNLLDPERAARLVAQRAIDASLPGLPDVVDRLFRAASTGNAGNSYEGEIARAVQHVVVENLIALADRAPMPQVRAIATLKLRQRMNAWSAQPAPAPGARAISQIAMNAYLADEIKRFLDRPSAPAQRPAVPEAPPGAPIGEPALDWLRRDDRWCSVDGYATEDAGSRRSAVRSPVQR